MQKVAGCFVWLVLSLIIANWILTPAKAPPKPAAAKSTLPPHVFAENNAGTKFCRVESAAGQFTETEFVLQATEIARSHGWKHALIDFFAGPDAVHVTPDTLPIDDEDFPLWLARVTILPDGTPPKFSLAFEKESGRKRVEALRGVDTPTPRED